MGFDKDEYDDLIRHVETYEDGQIIFEEGTPSAFVFIIAFGEVEIFRMIKGKKIIIDRVGEGESLGEMSFFDAYTRSAGARAIGKTGLMQFSDDLLMTEFEKMPESFKMFFKAMSLRMRSLMKKLTVLVDNPDVMNKLDELSKKKKPE